MPTTLQLVTSRTILDYRGQVNTEIEGRSCLTVAYKEHQKALAEFKSNPNAYPLAQMIVAWARMAERYQALNERPLSNSPAFLAWAETADALTNLIAVSYTGFHRRSLQDGIAEMIQSASAL